MDTNQKNIIDDYLTGRLSQAQASEFERQLSGDPDLQAEVNFQQQVVRGIQEYRKAQIKSRLGQVTVSPWDRLLYNSIGRTVMGITAAVIIGAGSYWIVAEDNQDDSLNVPGESIEAGSPDEIKTKAFEWNLPVAANDPADAQSTEGESAITKEESVGDVTIASSEEVVVETPSSDDESSTNFTPSITLPDAVSDVGEDNGIVVDPISKDLFEKSDVTSGDQIDINIEEKKSSVNSYKYFDGKLSLIGDFSKGPYQILEVIGQNGKNIFLFYNENFYSIKLTSEPKPLKKITDQEKISELEILKNHK